jgi:hypothetical protein
MVLQRQEGQEALPPDRNPNQRLASYREDEAAEKSNLVGLLFAGDAIDVSGTPRNLSAHRQCGPLAEQ